MIGRISGELLEKQAPAILVDVTGIAYEILVPMTTLFELPEIGQKVVLYTHLSVSENAHALYGFSEKTDKQLFRALIKVNGVGPKLALAILSGMTSHEFVACIQQGDSQPLVKLPGVGKKNS